MPQTSASFPCNVMSTSEPEEPAHGQITELLRHFFYANKEVTAADIIWGMKDTWPKVKPTSIRAAISRMLSVGQIAHIGKGRYRSNIYRGL